MRLKDQISPTKYFSSLTCTRLSYLFAFIFALTARTSILRSQAHVLRFSVPICKMSSQESSTVNFPSLSSSTPAEQFEVRQTSSSEDYTPDPLKSLPFSQARQSLIDDNIALYSCKPTIERVKRHPSDCVYDDQFVYANDRYKMAGQWFALPKLFKDSTNERYQIVKNDKDLIQFKNEQSWTFKIIPKVATINALVSLSTRILSRSSITKIRPTIKTTVTKVLDSASRNGKQITWLRIWIVKKLRRSTPIKGPVKNMSTPMVVVLERLQLRMHETHSTAELIMRQLNWPALIISCSVWHR